MEPDSLNLEYVDDTEQKYLSKEEAAELNGLRHRAWGHGRVSADEFKRMSELERKLW